MAAENQPITVVGKDVLVDETRKLKDTGHRLAQIACTRLDEGHELTYGFDLGYRYTSLRVLAAPGEEIPSVSGVYWAAFAYENEIHDLFGVPITGIAVDYKGKFYQTRVPFPFQRALPKKTTP